jgi:hypothetical protein
MDTDVGGIHLTGLLQASRAPGSIRPGTLEAGWLASPRLLGGTGGVLSGCLLTIKSLYRTG